MKSFVFRTLSPFFSRTATIKSYLQALGAKFGESVEPQVIERDSSSWQPGSS